METFKCAEDILLKYYSNDNDDISDLPYSKEVKNRAFKILFDYNLIPAEMYFHTQQHILTYNEISGSGIFLCETKARK